MEFSYRGVKYEKDLPTLDMTEGEIGGMYRGQAWNYRYPRHIPVPNSTPQLKYRGVNYCANPRATAEACYAAPAADRIDAKVGSDSPKCPEFEQQVEETHYRNICRRLEHRLEVAKQNGDRQLVKMLEAERELIGDYC
ncbi:DUF4278 domain-containing protein [Aerosakkonemataceae cyanobacterium BLCC-F154]|uniref:DUF4278 domain-containing protein n=1 Tax=Floridaenema fluviatile BLCC-F154 TaxID=3153640 RepID=A0ABV4YIS2_9CYAN